VQVVLVYLEWFRRNSLLKCVLQPKISKNSLKSPILFLLSATCYCISTDSSPKILGLQIAAKSQLQIATWSLLTAYRNLITNAQRRISIQRCNRRPPTDTQATPKIRVSSTPSKKTACCQAARSAILATAELRNSFTIALYGQFARTRSFIKYRAKH